jgi:hypothetical protein
MIGAAGRGTCDGARGGDAGKWAAANTPDPVGQDEVVVQVPAGHPGSVRDGGEVHRPLLAKHVSDRLQGQLVLGSYGLAVGVNQCLRAGRGRSRHQRSATRFRSVNNWLIANRWGRLARLSTTTVAAVPCPAGDLLVVALGGGHVFAELGEQVVVGVGAAVGALGSEPGPFPERTSRPQGFLPRRAVPRPERHRTVDGSHAGSQSLTLSACRSNTGCPKPLPIVKSHT